tara:strand:- start:27 stop:644 length:618 start_codon:yes stop_codon:yes gene_type:complete
MSKAIIESKYSRLDSDFGFNYLQMVSGLIYSEIVKLVGIKTRGKNKGELYGALHWKKCVRGGWVNQSMGGWYEDGAKGYAIAPNTKFDHSIESSGLNGRHRIDVDSNLTNENLREIRESKVWYSLWYNAVRKNFIEKNKECINEDLDEKKRRFSYKDNVDQYTREDLFDEFLDLVRVDRINQVRERIKRIAKNRIIKSIKEKENE